MARYRKKPVEVEAIQFDPDNRTEIVKWFEDMGHKWDNATIWLNIPPNTITINTLEGNMIANPGDYVIRGVQGEFYPCKPDIFEATYEKVEE